MPVPVWIMPRTTLRAGITTLGAALALICTTAATSSPTDTVPTADTVPATESRTVSPDGRTVVAHSGPVQLREGGSWTPVDLTLAAGADGVVRPVATPHDLSLTARGPIVRFAGGGSAMLDVDLLQPGAAGRPLAEPSVAGNEAVYAQIAPGFDLVVDATRTGFAAAVRAAGPATGPAPQLRVVPVPDEAGAEAQPDGFRFASGFASAFAPLVTADSAPAEPLGAAEAAAVAPSAISRVAVSAPGTPVAFDTTVQSTVAGTDLSGDPDLRVGTYDGAAVARSLLSFDVGGLGGRDVQRAVLRLHQEWSWSCTPAEWQVWTAAPAAVETRWATQPEAEQLWAASGDTRGNQAACAAGWSEVDVTDVVRAWTAAGTPTGSVLVRATDEASPAGWKRFGSGDGLFPPALEITLG